MRDPAGFLIGGGLVGRQKLTQQHLLGALLASVVLHVALLSQLSGTRSRAAPEPAPPVLITHLWMPAPPSLKPPSVAPTTPTEHAATGQQNTSRTVRQPSVSGADVPSAAAIPADNTRTPETPEPSASPSPGTDRPLDLSPQVISQAVRRNSNHSLAQAAREQLGSEPTPAAAKLGQHIASGAVPDCLHNAPDGEAPSKPVAIGGLFALPLVAYAAMTGKCK